MLRPSHPLVRLAAIAAAALVLAACTAPTEPLPPDGTLQTDPTAASSPPAATTTPTRTAEATASPERIEHGTAYAALLALDVKGRAPKTGYSREEFGEAWADVDGNGCDTRNDMLQLRLTDQVLAGTCTVLSGDLADPFTGTWIAFERGGASEVDIDHLVALSDAWQKGAARWDRSTREAFANDPLNLEPVDAGANRQKGDSDAATWLPAHTPFRCQYVARQVAVKDKYDLWVTQAELDAMIRVLDTCPEEPLPEGDAPAVVVDAGEPPQAGGGEEGPLDPRFDSCAAATAEGYGPYVRGEDEEYGWYRDGDSDGTVCER
ncbi:GmrSD restriction endonuclease domain-containing protein [Demequina silvatica]|uniref:GmrSD restriction endonuclease domain-containing protein n=1 Tax=Demequina silvatica TaxID=1638988 RepID=UPI0009E4C164|nr:DUF1524 domain-containing protein [Demequina silvatica]